MRKRTTVRMARHHRLSILLELNATSRGLLARAAARRAVDQASMITLSAFVSAALPKVS